MLRIKKYNSSRFYQEIENSLANNSASIKQRYELFRKSLSQKNKIFFYYQLATLLEAGIPLLQALDILIGNQKKLFFKNILIKVRSEVAQGSYLSAALEACGNNFNPLLCRLLAAGEQSGCLGATLLEVANYLDAMEKLKQRVFKLLSYPALLLVSCGLVTFYIFNSVVPRFEAFFLEMHFTLPVCTRGLFAISHFFQTLIFKISLAILFISLLCFTFYCRQFFLFLPFINRIYLNQLQCRLAYIISMVLNAGLSLHEGLNWAAQSLQPGAHKSSILIVKEKVCQGYSLTQSVKEAGLFCSNFVQMIAVGEESGSLVSLLQKLIVWLNHENEHFLTRFFAIFEPFLLICFGIMIFFLILAIYLPLIKLMGAL